jgi:rhodanese-related sulfurtransferase
MESRENTSSFLCANLRRLPKFICFVGPFAFVSPGLGFGKKQEDSPAVSQSANAQAQTIEKLVREFEGRFSVGQIRPAQSMVGGGAPDPRYIFVDVRPNSERLVSRIPGSLSLQEFREGSISSANQAKTFVFYCTIGYRSSQVAQRLKDGSLKDGSLKVVNLRGGLIGWVHSGGLVVGANGKETKKFHVYGDKWNVLPPGYSPVQ